MTQKISRLLFVDNLPEGAPRKGVLLCKDEKELSTGIS